MESEGAGLHSADLRPEKTRWPALKGGARDCGLVDHGCVFASALNIGSHLGTLGIIESVDRIGVAHKHAEAFHFGRASRSINLTGKQE